MVRPVNLYDMVIVASVAFVSAFTIALNNFANDKNKNETKTPLLYISESFISALSGIFISMGATLFIDNPVVWYMVAGIGGFAGRRLLFAFVRIFFVLLTNSKNIDIGNIENKNNETEE